MFKVSHLTGFGAGGSGSEVSEVGDFFFSDVVFLSGFEGADESTTIDDESTPNHTMTAQDNAQIDTAQFKFGASSLLLDGTGDYVSSPDSDDWTLAGVGEGFTVEAFIRPNASGSGNRVICSHFNGVGNDKRSWAFRHNSADTISFFWYESGTSTPFHIATSSGTITDGVWTHVAASRDSSGVLRIFIGGVLDGTVTDTSAMFDSDADFRIGCIFNPSATEFFDGHIDELRVTKNVGRYTTNFTPPSVAFPRS